MKHAEIEKVIREMTLEEKAGLCSGADMWHTKAVERLGVKKIVVSDGPHGLRTQHGEGDNLGINGSISAVCFPAACATAASFDRALLRDLGETLGDECVAEGVSVLLGPAVNIKRTPLCGRNFEYFSEDPYLSGELAAEYGVKTVAGADAHRPEDVWGNIEDAFAIAEKFGLEICNAEVARKILAQR